MSLQFRNAVTTDDAETTSTDDSRRNAGARAGARGILPGTIAGGFNPTVRKFRNNVTRLLHIESATEQAHHKSREALVHAGKMAAVGRMVAGVNHEIKRPLASMQLFIEHLEDLIESGEKEEALQTLALLAHAAEQLDDLSRQLEDFSRKSPLDIAAISVQEAADHACSVLSPKIRTGQHELRVSAGGLRVAADLDRLTLALVNLVDNALDATAGMADRRIDIAAREEKGGIVIAVRDRGPGIPGETMDRLFEAFFTTKPQGKGLGLGLALSSEVIAEMNGRLAVRNHPDGGCEFTIRLPSAGET